MQTFDIPLNECDDGRGGTNCHRLTPDTSDNNASRARHLKFAGQLVAIDIIGERGAAGGELYKIFALQLLVQFRGRDGEGIGRHGALTMDL